MLMLLFRPRRNVYRVEKQSPQRFTTGILTQQETQGRRVRRREGGRRGGGGDDDGRKDRKGEVEQRGLELEKWCTRKRKAASQGIDGRWRGKRRRKRRKSLAGWLAGWWWRWEEEGGTLEYSTIIIWIEINFKYPQIKASFHGLWLGPR